jgi:hypothetical protein
MAMLSTNNFGTGYSYYFNNFIWVIVTLAVTIAGIVVMAFSKKEFND